MKPHEDVKSGGPTNETGFPRWDISLMNATPSEAGTTREDADGTATRASPSLSSSDCGVTCGGANTFCGQAAAVAADGGEGSSSPESGRYWPRGETAGTESESTLEDGPLSAVRELVVKFARNVDLDATTNKQQQQQQTLNQRKCQHLKYRQKLQSWQQQRQPRIFGGEACGVSFPVWRETSNCNATPAPEQGPKIGKEPDGNCPLPVARCLLRCTLVRVLTVILYYLIIWVASALVTYLLLQLSLSLTSRGRFPYYMSGHSFYLESPVIGFAVGNSEPGVTTEIASLSDLRDELAKKLGRIKSGSEARQCDSLAAPQPMGEAELMRPCNMTLFIAMATEAINAVAMARPAALVEIRRHLGYLPAKDKIEVSCTCTADGKSLAVKYHSWNGVNMTDSSGSGNIPDVYFPMLSKQHSAPPVLVSLGPDVTEADWVGKKLKLECKAFDGDKTSKPKELLLVVKRV